MGCNKIRNVAKIKDWKWNWNSCNEFC